MKKIGTVFMATLLILDGMFGEMNIQAATFNPLEKREEQNRIYDAHQDTKNVVQSKQSPVVTGTAVLCTCSPMVTDVASGGSVSTEEPSEEGKGEFPETNVPGRTEVPSCAVTPAASLKPTLSCKPTQMPAATIAVLPTEKPIEFPEETPEAPVESESPVVTMAPSTTKTPIFTERPEKTMRPVQVTAGPTLKPPITMVTTGSGVTETMKPADTSNNEHTKAPTATGSPDNNAADSIVYCTVHYKLNGGTNVSGNPSRVYASGASYRLQDPKKKGHSFEGWYSESSFKHRCYYVKPNGNSSVTYYAKWKVVTVAKAKIVSVKRIKNGKIRVKVGNCSGADGYEYVYSLTPTMAKKSLVRSVRNPKDLTKQKRKARYYIKVRCYKYDSWGRKIYGSYSKVVKCK